MCASMWPYWSPIMHVTAAVRELWEHSKNVNRTYLLLAEMKYYSTKKYHYQRRGAKWANGWQWLPTSHKVGWRWCFYRLRQLLGHISHIYHCLCYFNLLRRFAVICFWYELRTIIMDSIRQYMEWLETKQDADMDEWSYRLQYIKGFLRIWR